MILEIGQWIFDIDMTATMKYYAAEAAEHCTCSYCRNFYATVDEVYPDLRPFLAQFGVTIDAPSELMPFDMENEMWYEGVFAVSGKIISVGSTPLRCNGIDILVTSDNISHINHQCPEPCFYVGVGMLVLPWILDEPMEDVISPANEPSFLKKMWNRLLGRQAKNKITS